MKRSFTHFLLHTLKFKKMKTQILLLSFLCCSIFSYSQNAVTKEQIKVAGNCNSCKKNIETAAKSAGANTAVWNKETKVLAVSFDASKTSDQKIQQKIASAGYDTQSVTATDAAYNKLDDCCQYDRKSTNKAVSAAYGMGCCKDKASCKKDCCSKEDMSCCKGKDAKHDCCSGGDCCSK